MKNASGAPGEDVATRIARRTAERRAPDYAGEVRRLIGAGRVVMRRCGTGARPRVADIVAEAGLSNEAFYRHFPSKDALVAAILDDGTEQLESYLAHQLAKEPTPEGRVRRWVEVVLSRAEDEEAAATTLAVMWNAASLGPAASSVDPAAPSRSSVAVRLAPLVRASLAELGADDPDLSSELVAHAVVGHLTDLLWRRTRPDRAGVDGVVAFCLAAAAGGPAGRAR